MGWNAQIVVEKGSVIEINCCHSKGYLHLGQ